MIVTVAAKGSSFRPWSPLDGKVFASSFAFDCETTRIDEGRPWITPAYVLGAAHDGERGYFVRREHVADFFRAHEENRVILHNASFDLDVIHVLARDLDIYRWVDRGLVYDTRLLHRLLTLASEGHTARGEGQSTLERCADLYLGITLPKDVQDSGGNPIRLSYDRWLNRPPREIEPVYLEYLARDAIVTWQLYVALMANILECLETSCGVWGELPYETMVEQIRKWGPLTHHIQLRAAIVLRAITANGLTVDLERRDALLHQIRQMADERRAALARHGYVPHQKGSVKALQEIIRRLAVAHPDLEFPRTPTNRYVTAKDALEQLAGVVPFAKELVEYNALDKLESSFLSKMGKRVLHPSFDVLKTTGRTSSFGELNAQNLPRDDRVRSCFVPAPGHVFINADYKAIEMVTLAQALRNQFGLESRLAAVLDAGEDPHVLVAAIATGKPEADVTKDDRQRAKPINFGKPGAMGNRSLQAYARTSYGVELADAEVERLSEAWFRLFPEMGAFLEKSDLGLDVARLYDLTPAAYYEHTARRLRADRDYAHHAALGGMCLKTLKAAEPATANGRRYTDEEIDFFWSRVEARLDLLPGEHHHGVRQRRPSPSLHRAVMATAGRAGVWTATGRLRARATFPARHNNVFQGLAADGAKLALWRLWRAGYRIANFIHDEMLVEVPADSDLTHHAGHIERLMIEGMREVVPDIRIDVESVATTVWSKGAKDVHDDRGRLIAWSPPEVPIAPGPAVPAIAEGGKLPPGEKRRGIA